MTEREVSSERVREERLKLWFFRDLSSEQRLKLFGLLGMPVEEIGDIHGHQTKAFRHMLLALRSSVKTVGEAWSAPAAAPKDGTMLRLLIKPDADAFTSFEDSTEPYVTIGFNQFADTQDDEWHFAGWDWSHDCITQGRGEVIGWQAFTHPSPIAPSEVTHPDDIAVDRFAAAMKAKLSKKRSEGRGGWERKDECTAEFLSHLLREHVAKGDPLDVGNLAMMLHQRDERITP